MSELAAFGDVPLNATEVTNVMTAGMFEAWQKMMDAGDYANAFKAADWLQKVYRMEVAYEASEDEIAELDERIRLYRLGEGESQSMET